MHTSITPGAVYPKGWHHQMDDEATINGRYEFQKTRPLLKRGKRRIADAVLHAGGNAGTAFGYLQGGGTLRIGTDINEFVQSQIQPSVAFAPLAVRRDDGGRQRPEIYAFGKIETRLVGWNRFLAGNGTASDRDLDPRSNVTDQQVGLVVRWSRYRVSYALLHRSGEFRRDNGHRFGVLTFSMTR